MNKISKKSIISTLKMTALFATALFSACSEEIIEENPVTPASDDNKISFAVSAEQNWQDASTTQTRASAGMPGQTVSFDDDIDGKTVLFDGDIDGQQLYLVEEVVNGINSNDSTMTVSSEPEQTRGTMVTSIDNFYNKFHLYAYQHAGTFDATDKTSIINADVTQTDGVWTYSPIALWPAADNVTFFAYAPTSASGVSVATTGVPTVSYTVPSTVADQKDLMVSNVTSIKTPGIYRGKITLPFDHICTAIKFKVSASITKNITITDVKISGVYNKGDYEIGGDWTVDDSSTKDYQLNGLSVSYTAGSENVVVNDGENIFMMIPQTLPDDAKISIRILEGGETKTISAKINGKTWAKGQTVTYSIASRALSTDYTIESSAIPTFDFLGGDQNTTVSSYSTYNGTNSPENFKVQYKNENNEWVDGLPNYMKLLQNGTEVTDLLNMPGSISGTEYTVEMGVSPLTSADTHTNLLRAQTPKSDYDLSTKGGTTTRNTANCYIITAPGTYKLPLVYGNAVRNGEDNKYAYNYDYNNSADTRWENLSDLGDQGKKTALRVFKNHLGLNITDAYINNNKDANNNNLTAASAHIVWQDAYNLVTNPTLTTESGIQYLNFTVDKDFICQGNSLLSVKDSSGRIMWSWHIWVTDNDEATQTVTVGDNKFAKINLGWADPYEKTYGARSVDIRFVQLNSTSTVSSQTVNQTAGSLSSDGSSLYYQYARKDPAPAVIKNSNGEILNIKLYNQTDAWRLESNRADLANAIKHPNLFFGGNTSLTYDLWHLRGTGTAYRNVAYDDSYINESQLVSDGECSPSDGFWNLWNANEYRKGTASGRTADEAKTTVVKTIYDPCPPGYSIPPSGAYKVLLTYTKELVASSATELKHYKFTINGETLKFHAFGFRTPLASSNHIAGDAAGYDTWGLYAGSQRTGSYDKSCAFYFLPTNTIGVSSYQDHIGSITGIGAIYVWNSSALSVRPVVEKHPTDQ